jgi:molybdopterin molybdotransferase
MLLALPGNPVAALVSFYAFAQPALRLLAGANEEAPRGLRAKATAAIRKRPGRTEFQRAVLSLSAAGECEIKLTGSQSAGILRSMSEANALVVLGHDQGLVAAGEWVEVWPFDGLV